MNMADQVPIKSELGVHEPILEHQAAHYNKPMSNSRKLNEFVRNRSKPEDAHVTIGIVPDGMSPAECLEKKALQIRSVAKSDIISSVAARYAEENGTSAVVQFSRVSGNKQIESKAKIRDVANRSYFVVLKATKVQIAEFILWEVFATQFMSIHIHGLALQSADYHKVVRQLYDEWSGMPIELRNLLGKQAKHLVSSDCSDRFSQLAFWCYYQDFYEDSKHARPHETIRRRESLFTTVLKNWRQQTFTRIAQRKNDAVEHEKRFPVPRAPTSVSMEKIIEEAKVMDPFLVPQNRDANNFMNMPLEALERTYEVSLDLLKAIEPILPSDDARFKNWLQGINFLTQKAPLMPMKIGIMGGTGLGKSTIINALLNQKDLLPTSFVQACTAAPIEIRFDDSMKLQYRVNIKFLSEHAWTQEILTCLQYLKDPSAVHDEGSKEAAAKIRAAYPDFTKDDMDQDNLLGVEDIRNKLGTTTVLEAETSAELTRIISRFVASKEDSGRQRDWSYEDRLYWPLVESIELCLRAPILQSGVVLVDLPGGQDSNKARAAVARNYQASCSHIFFLSDITRAASDEAIVSFISERERGQVEHKDKNTTSIICSKTDQMSVDLNNANSVGVEQQFIAFEAQKREIEARIIELENKLSANKVQSAADEERYSMLKSELGFLNDDLSRSNAGSVVFERANDCSSISARSELSNKRTRRERLAALADDSNGRPESTSEGRKTLSGTEIQSKIDFTKADMRATFGRLDMLDRDIDGLEESLTNLRALLVSIEENKYRLCHNGRNTYTRLCLQKKITHELEEIRNEISRRPQSKSAMISTRSDYANDVIVPPQIFCVAAKSYLEQAGSHLSHEDTEIPQLYEHCLQLCEEKKLTQLLSKVNASGALISALRIWAYIESSHGKLSTEEQERMLEDLQKHLQASEGDFRNEINSLKDRLWRILRDRINKAIKDGIIACHSQAALQVDVWGKSLSTSMWRQTVRRHGEYSGKSATNIDFNRDLSAPLIKELSRIWDVVLTQDLPNELDATASNFCSMFSKMHQTAYQHVANLRPGSLALSVLQKHPHEYELLLANTLDDIRSVITETRWDFKKWAPETIRNKLTNTYNGAAAYTGHGSAAKMKEYFMKYVQEKRNANSIFKAVETTTRERIKDIFSKTLERFSGQVEDIIKQANQDYLNAVSNPGEKLSNEERQLRARVADLLRTFDENCTPSPAEDENGTSDDTHNQTASLSDKLTEAPVKIEMI